MHCSPSPALQLVQLRCSRRAPLLASGDVAERQPGGCFEDERGNLAAYTTPSLNVGRSGSVSVRETRFFRDRHLETEGV
jgi:hypothetical protein